MALDFPNSPTIGQEFASVETGKTWVWDGAVWSLKPTLPGVLVTPTPPTGVPIGQIWINSDTGDEYWWNGTSWEPFGGEGGGGGGASANLAWIASSSTVTSDSGTDAVLTQATTSLPGLMNSAHVSKLNGIENGAQVTKMPVAGATGQVLAKTTGADYATGWIDPPAGGGGGTPTSRLINTTAPLTGGGDLTADRTLAINTFTQTVKGAVPAPTTLAGAFLKDDGTWALPPSAASGAAGVFPFQYNVSTAEAITGNQMRGNVFPITGSTKLWVSETTTDGLNVAVGLGRIKSGGQVYIQDFSDATKFALFNVTADATDKGNYWEITVALASSGGSMSAGKVALQSLTPVVDYTGAINALKATVYASVNHGAVAGTARPTGYAGVIWYGSVQPTNAVAPDFVIRTDEAV